MTKRTVILILVFAICIAFSGCTKAENTDTDKSNGRMVVIDRSGTWRILVDKETGVMYLNSKVYGGESMCVMVNKDGSPAIYKGGDLE